MEKSSSSDTAGQAQSLADLKIKQSSIFSPKLLLTLNADLIEAFVNTSRSRWFQLLGMMRYSSGFMAPFWSILRNFYNGGQNISNDGSSWGKSLDFIKLLLFEVQLTAKGAWADMSAISRYHLHEMSDMLTAVENTLLEKKDEDLVRYSERQLRLMDTVVNAYPEAVREVESEYGFHLDTDGYVKVAETDRFELYQVLPTDKKIKVRDHGKPVMIIPPYVLGANILAFLPGENRSYVHAFANRGIPTYIRLVKDINKNPAVQLMRGEDDVLDTRYFCEKLLERNGRPVTLNGYCQGGFMAVLGILSGELDGLVDALTTCVAPMDGSRSKGLVEYIEHLPYRFRNLGYATKVLPNGNRVVDGKVMSWVYKLKSIQKESPLFTFYRDIGMFEAGAQKVPRINKVAAAISHWLTYDITNIPVEITRLSFESYTKPVAGDGTLPVMLFGRSLNFKRLKEKGIKWLICIAEKDELVEEASALAPLNYVDAEVTRFPKGHTSIAVSWSSPAAECALHMNYDKAPCGTDNSRGPVRFQLDLEEEQSPKHTFQGAPSEPRKQSKPGSRARRPAGPNS
ncbi:MAG: metal transporter [Syntrophobacteraceae bacterium]